MKDRCVCNVRDGLAQRGSDFCAKIEEASNQRVKNFSSDRRLVYESFTRVLCSTAAEYNHNINDIQFP